MQAELIQSMGSDDIVVNAARVSFSKVASNYTGDQNTKLINYLAKHNHFTPFTHCVITMRERVPIFVARQRFKHTVGFSYNEVSRRYVDDMPDFYYPTEWRGKPVNAKQGSSDEVITHMLMHSNVETWSTEVGDAYQGAVECCKQTYECMIRAGIAPEQARMVLPQSMYTEYYTTGSLFAWARAFKLRIDAHAQKEIQELAAQWDNIIQPLFPISWAALIT